MLLLGIYLVFCSIVFLLYVITFLLYEIDIYKIIHTDTIKQREQKIKSTEEILCVHIKMFIMSFTPIINLLMLYTLLFKNDKIKSYF